MLFAFAILAIGGFAIYVLTPEERRRLLAAAASSGGRAGHWLVDGERERTRFLDALRTRTKWPLVTVVIVGVNVVAFLMMPSVSSGSTDAVLGAGASYGPRTANGEWWRLVTAVFVHRSALTLLFDLAIIAAFGVLIERLLGPITFALVFVAGGALANCVYLAGHPLDIRAGSWGAIYALMGPIAVWVLRSLRTSADLSLPRPVLRAIGCVTVVFALVSVIGDRAGLAANLSALLFGLVAGAVTMRGITDSTPAPGRLAVVAGVALVVSCAVALPSRGIADVRPELARVLTLESQTTPAYDKAVGQFKLGATTAEALAQTIDRRILPQLREAQARVAALRGVLPEHRPLVADAQQYVRLRIESWELRASALHKRNMRGLRAADDRERASLDALDRLKAAELR